MQNYVYLLTDGAHERFFVGLTRDIQQRLREHEQGSFDAVTGQCQCAKLVWFEIYISMGLAKRREAQIKCFDRDRYAALVNATNPWWRNLADAWKARAPGALPSFSDTPPLNPVPGVPPNLKPDEQLLSPDIEDTGDHQ